MELEVEFGDKTMKTVVYIKMDARDQLLLSEGVCRQLGLVMYHLDVQVWHGGKDKKPPTESKDVAIVPMVRAKLVNSVRVLPQQCSLVSVKLEMQQNTYCLNQKTWGVTCGWNKHCCLHLKAVLVSIK